MPRRRAQDAAAAAGEAAAPGDFVQLDAQAAGEEPTVLYIGHIPHGFYEQQMLGFFSQFGGVERLRLSRNKKSGKSKHYAFVEFADADVCKAVHEAMDGYLLFDKQVTCAFIPPARVHDRMFDGANRKFKKTPWRRIARERHNAPRDAEQEQARADRLTAKERKKRKKLQEAGIDYDFPGYEAQARRKAVRTAL